MCPLDKPSFPHCYLLSYMFILPFSAGYLLTYFFAFPFFAPSLSSARSRFAQATWCRAPWYRAPPSLLDHDHWTHAGPYALHTLDGQGWVRAVLDGRIGRDGRV